MYSVKRIASTTGRRNRYYGIRSLCLFLDVCTHKIVFEENLGFRCTKGLVVVGLVVSLTWSWY